MPAVPTAKKAELPPLDVKGMINQGYVPVDLKALTALIDGMIARFHAQVDELEAVRKLLK